jgi:hypothetical protein
MVIPSLNLQRIHPPLPRECAARMTSSAAILPVLILFSPSASPPGSSRPLRALQLSSRRRCSLSETAILASGWTPQNAQGNDWHSLVAKMSSPGSLTTCESERWQHDLSLVRSSGWVGEGFGGGAWIGGEMGDRRVSPLCPCPCPCPCMGSEADEVSKRPNMEAKLGVELGTLPEEEDLNRLDESGVGALNKAEGSNSGNELSEGRLNDTGRL